MRNYVSAVKAFFLTVAMMMSLVAHARYENGRYYPDQEAGKDGVLHYEKFNFVSWPWSCQYGWTTQIDGSVYKTTSAGITRIEFSIVHPQYQQPLSVKWSGKLRYPEQMAEFEYDGHTYVLQFDGGIGEAYGKYQLWMILCVDGTDWYNYAGIPDKPLTPTVDPVWKKSRALNGIACRSGDSMDRPLGLCQVKCGKADRNGQVSVSVTITPISGKKISYKAKKFTTRGSSVVASWSGFSVTIDGDSFSGGEETYDGVKIASAVIGGEWFGTRYFDFGDLPESIDGNYVLYPNEYEGGGFFEPIQMAGKKWSLSRAAKMKWVKCPPNALCGPGSWDVDTSGGKTNISGLKLTYNPKTGLFKGSFTLYTWSQGGKKYKVSVNGLIINGLGYGEAVVKKPYTTWAVSIDGECAAAVF